MQLSPTPLVSIYVGFCPHFLLETFLKISHLLIHEPLLHQQILNIPLVHTILYSLFALNVTLNFAKHTFVL